MYEVYLKMARTRQRKRETNTLLSICTSPNNIIHMKYLDSHHQLHAFQTPH